MNCRERVVAVIEKRSPDRVPLYMWAFANLEDQITQEFGSVAAFEDKYEFDYAHIFGGPGTYREEQLIEARNAVGGDITPEMLMDIPMSDPNDMSQYTKIIQEVKHHKERGRFIHSQNSGIFEPMNWPYEMQNHLVYMMLNQDEVQELYRRQTDWNMAVINNFLDLGMDMIHISDDWGAQAGLLFSPKLWWEMIYPCHVRMAELVKSRGAYLSLHSDGNVMEVADGIVKIGFDVVHPWQEAAGMSYDTFLKKYKNSFTIMGGLDIQTAVGFGKIDFLKSEIDRILALFPDKRILLNTTHFIQDHCTMEELRWMSDYVYEKIRE